MQQLWLSIARSAGYPVDNSTYFANPKDKYFSNYNPATPCVVVDDLGDQAPSLKQVDESLARLIRMVNNVPYMVEQADVESKGRTPFLSHVVIGSTNVEDLNVRHFAATPAAVLRRFKFVEVTVKPEFLTPGTTMLDVDKATANPHASFHTLTVFEWLVNGTSYRRKNLKTFDTISGFCKWAVTDFRTHCEH